jgi:hypothetical protein
MLPGAALLIATLTLSAPSQQPHQQAHPPEGQSQTTQRPPEAAISRKQEHTDSPTVDKPRTSEETNKTEERIAKAAERQASATIVLAVLAFVTGIIVYYYARQAKRQAEATLESAKAAKQSADVARDLLYIKRSRILVVPGTVTNLDEPGRIGTIPYAASMQWSIANIGETPAQLKEVSAELRLMAQDELLAQPLSAGTLPGFANMPIAPDGTHPGTEQRAFVDSEADLKTIRKQKKLLHFFGSVTYVDIFGKEHTTRFCFFLKSFFHWDRPIQVPTEWMIAGDKRWNSDT